jgi:hypothetical protein
MGVIFMRSFTVDKLTGVCTRLAPASCSGLTPKQYFKLCEKELRNTPGGLDGLCFTGSNYRSEKIINETGVVINA